MFFLCGVFAFPSTKAKAITSPGGILPNTSFTSSVPGMPGKHPGDSPFIRFHHGISESNVSVASSQVFIILLKSVNELPEKFAGTVRYISSAYRKVPVSQVFLYALPLRSPPIFS